MTGGDQGQGSPATNSLQVRFVQALDTRGWGLSHRRSWGSSRHENRYRGIPCRRALQTVRLGGPIPRNIANPGEAGKTVAPG
jgi:hypothetical protein